MAPTNSMIELVLASASPRRAELLSGLGLSFRVVPSGLAEQNVPRPHLLPGRHAEKLALDKAMEVARRIDSGLVLGADTVVTLPGAILGKPADTDDAYRMLRLLSGRWHEVHTGLALVAIGSGAIRSGHERTRVKFRPLTANQIEAYVLTGESLDKAGAYGIQGHGAVLIERIEGCYTNVVGLPLARLARMLSEFGLTI